MVLAGNHDHALVRPWLRTRIAAGRPIGLAARVPVASGAALQRLTGFLAPARVRVQYPGTWVGRGYPAYIFGESVSRTQMVHQRFSRWIALNKVIKRWSVHDLMYQKIGVLCELRQGREIRSVA